MSATRTWPVPLLDVRGLKKYFPVREGGWGGNHAGVVRALDGVSLQVPAGESFGLVGESGSGKTTLALCILRLIEPSQGEIYFEGEDFLKLSPGRLRRRRKDLQMVFQDPYTSLNPRMSAAEIIEEPLRIHRMGGESERRQRVRDLLESVGLPHGERYPHELSGGERQRVAIARALATRPKFLVADEAVSSLDVSVQAQIIQLLGRLKEEFSLTLLFVAHALPVVRYLCERVAVMYGGRIVELAKTRDLFENPIHPYTGELIRSVPAPDPGVQRPRRGKRGGVFTQPGADIPELTEVAPGHWVAQ